MSRYPLEQRLTDAGTARKAAEKERGRSAAYLQSLVRRAAKEGWSKTRIAEVAGISRQTVHDMLRVKP